MEDPAYNRIRRTLCAVVALCIASCSASMVVTGCAPAGGETRVTLPEPVRAIAPRDTSPGQSSPPATVDESDPVSTAEIAQPTRPLPIPPKPLPTPPTHEPTVAIRIDELAIGARVVVETAAGRVEIASLAAPESEVPWIAATPVEIRAQDGGWKVTPRGKAARAFAAGELEIRPAKGSSELLALKKQKWPGVLRLVRTSQSIDVVIDVPIETYLPGVIAKELYGSWDESTFRAQAIAARSYAVVEAARWQGRRHYDMVAGQQSQAWIGATDNAKAVAAVRETRGQVLVDHGVVVPAYYSSACGGRAANASGVVTDNPFHDIVPLSAGDGAPRPSCCQSASVATWKVTIALATIQARIASWGRGIGRSDLATLALPIAIEIADKNAAGRPTTIRLRPRSGGAVTIEAEDFRRAMNAAGDSKTSMRSSDFSVSISAKNADFTGRGFGHGVGLCQHGAQEMARKGSSYQQILARYYPDSMIMKAWK